MQSARETAADLTPRFEAFLNAGAFDKHKVHSAFEKIRARAKGVHFVLVPPFLSDVSVFEAERYRLVGFLPALKDWMELQGFTVSVAPLSTQAGTEENGARLLGMVRASEKPVCFIGHSKGGVDTLSCLIQAEDDDLEKIAGFITFQSPLAGSPIADIGDKTALRRALAVLLTRWGGTYQSLKDLCTADREGYLARYDAAIRHVCLRVPQLSIATHRASKWYEPGWLTTRIMLMQGKENDALVPVESAILPHGRFVVIPEIEHAAVTMKKDSIAGRYDRTAFHEVMLALLFG